MNSEQRSCVRYAFNPWIYPQNKNAYLKYRYYLRRKCTVQPSAKQAVGSLYSKKNNRLISYQRHSHGLIFGSQYQNSGVIANKMHSEKTSHGIGTLMPPETFGIMYDSNIIQLIKKIVLMEQWFRTFDRRASCAGNRAECSIPPIPSSCGRRGKSHLGEIVR